jgi:hypothetical protein
LALMKAKNLLPATAMLRCADPVERNFLTDPAMDYHPVLESAGGMRTLLIAAADSWSQRFGLLRGGSGRISVSQGFQRDYRTAAGARYGYMGHVGRSTCPLNSSQLMSLTRIVGRFLKCSRGRIDSRIWDRMQCTRMEKTAIGVQKLQSWVASPFGHSMSSPSARPRSP